MQSSTELKGSILPFIHGGEQCPPQIRLLILPERPTRPKLQLPRASLEQQEPLSLPTWDQELSGLVTCTILTEHPASGHSQPLGRNELMTPRAEEGNRNDLFWEHSPYG